MDKFAAVRRLPDDVAGEAKAGGVEIARDLHCFAFLIRQDRLERKETLQQGRTLAVYLADCGPDLGVAIGVDRLLEKIDQPGLSL
jgi:hypothetical protein